MFERYANLVINKPYRILLLMIAFVALLVSSIPSIIFSDDFKLFFSEDNPQLIAFDKLEETFNRQENIYFYIAPKNKNIFTKENLTLIHELTAISWTFPDVLRVDSLSNFQHTVVNGDDLTTNHLVDDPKKLSKSDISYIKNIAINEIYLLNRVITKAATVTGINILVNPDKKNLSANRIIVEHAQKIVADLKQRYPDVNISLSGTTFANYSLGLAVQQDMKELVGLSYLIILIGLLVFLRSFSAMMITLFIISFSIAGTFGVFAWFGIVFTAVAGFVPSMIITIGVADSVHILISYFYEIRQGQDKKKAIFEALRINALPIFVTTITTIIGVLMLNFSDSPPYQDLGNMLAVGVLLAYVFSMLLLPALLSILPARQAFSKFEFSLQINGFANFVIRKHRFLLYAVSFVVVVFTGFISNNTLTERWNHYFDDSFEQRRTIDAINDNLSGVHAIRYSIDTGIKNGINNPAYLTELDQFSQWYRQQPGVAYVSSISDTIKRLNKNMHQDQDDYYRIPKQQDLVAQYLFLYELSLPRGLGLENRINFERSSSYFLVLLKTTDSKFLLDIEQRSRDWLHQNTKTIKISEGTGLDMVFAHINHRNIRSLLMGTGFALFLISIILIIVLQSLRIGLISLLPNLAPAALAYGTWGLFVGEIDLSASVVMCMTLGIVVDDTVHFLLKYRRARREKNYDVNEGIRYAFNTVGVALTITTVVLVSGFLVLTTSHLSFSRHIGALLSITLIYALIIDFLLLPSLLIFIDKYIKTKVV